MLGEGSGALIFLKRLLMLAPNLDDLGATLVAIHITEEAYRDEAGQIYRDGNGAAAG